MTGALDACATILSGCITLASAQVSAGHVHAAAPRPASMANEAPPPPAGHAADRYYDPGEMAAARRALHAEHGAMRVSMLLFNLAEYESRRGPDGFRWDGEYWSGGDIDRLEIATEGEATLGRRVDDAEVQLLWNHALDPYFNIRSGVRQDFGAGPSRTYLTTGIEGVAPYWFNLEGLLFLSQKGQVSARVKVDYDQRITQRFIVQPRVEANLAASSDRRRGIGSGLTDIELGVRARYELRRELAPYVGINWYRQLGRTADIARTSGEDINGVSAVFGVRWWL